MNKNELSNKFGNKTILLTGIKQTTANFDFQDEDENVKIHLELPVGALPKVEREVKLNDILKLNPEIKVDKLNK